MDLALYTRVLSRFRVLVVGGVVLACLLAFFSYAKVSMVHGSLKLGYRQAETWQSTTRLLITQPGFQIGKLSLGNPDPTATTTNPIVSPGYLASLAPSYEQIGNSDAVRAMFKRDDKGRATMTVAAEYGGSNNTEPTGVLDVNGLGTTPADAGRASQRGTAVLIDYVRQEQCLNGVAAANRVQLEVLNKAAQAVVLVGRKKTLPIVIFVAVMTAAIGLAFMLENLRPRVRAVPADTDEEPRLRSRISA
jgi:hypothetical protein